MSKETARTEFAVRLTREFPEANPVDITNTAETLLRAARRYRKLQENLCSYPDEGGRWEKESDKLEKKILEAFAKLGGLGVEFSGDPRGCCVYLKVPSGYSDDWGGRGLCVPSK